MCLFFTFRVSQNSFNRLFTHRFCGRADITLVEIVFDNLMLMAYNYLHRIRQNAREAQVMNTKLTLRMDDSLIESAKQYSAKSGKSVSRIVADLFEIIKNEKLEKHYPTTPAVLSLKGALKGKPVDEKDYKRYLEEKYS